MIAARAGIILVLIYGLAACAKAGRELSARDPHMFELAPGQTMAAVYFTLDNPTTVAKTLHHLSSPIASHVEVHGTLYQDGMMQMREINNPVVPPADRLRFEPAGLHIMLFDVAEAPAVGSTFPLVLEFDTGEVLTLAVEVRARQ